MKGGLEGRGERDRDLGGESVFSKKLVLALPTVVPIQLAVPIQTTLNKTHEQVYAHTHGTGKDSITHTHKQAKHTRINTHVYKVKWRIQLSDLFLSKIEACTCDGIYMCERERPLSHTPILIHEMANCRTSRSSCTFTLQQFLRIYARAVRGRQHR